MNDKFLASTRIIDWQDRAVSAMARKLSSGLKDDCSIAQKCFEFVRDEIFHSNDHKMNPVTLRASEVLAHRTGYCYAKSHLLAALLRANGIPAGLCYQRLKFGEYGIPYCIHGLNAVYLKDFGWYRVDARGNREGIDARFDPPRERLAYHHREDLIADLPEIWTDPLPVVVATLSSCATYIDVLKNIPDVELIRQ